MAEPRPVRAPRGTEISCKGWQQEAALRMLMNNLDPEVAEEPEELIVYGGTGRAARNWECFDAIVAALRALRDDETLLVQSGKPVGVFRTHEMAPRVLIANSTARAAVGDLGGVPPSCERDGPDDVRPDDGRLLDLHRHAGHPAGHVRDVRRRARQQALRRHRWQGKLVLTAGLGGMGGAQPLAVTMNEGVALVVEVDPAPHRAPPGDRATSTWSTDNLDEALELCAKARARAASRCPSACSATPPTSCPSWSRAASTPTWSPTRPRAHDALNGYVPNGMTLDEALELRRERPRRVRRAPMASMVVARRGHARAAEAPARSSSTTATTSAASAP